MGNWKDDQPGSHGCYVGIQAGHKLVAPNNTYYLLNHYTVCFVFIISLNIHRYYFRFGQISLVSQLRHGFYCS